MFIRAAILVVMAGFFQQHAFGNTDEMPTVEDKERSPPFFMVIAPDKVRSFSEYVVAITLVGTKKPTSVDVSIVKEEGEQLAVPKATVVIQPNSVETVKFQLEEMNPVEYKLVVQGDESFNFNDSKPLKFAEKIKSVHIQTDRAMYKPGHKVQFRVLVLNSHLLPSKLNTINVVVKDAQNNRIKEWNDKKAVKGVFSGEIQLSAHPVLGDWAVVVNTDQNEYKKIFTVAEYVLPKFEVLVDVPAHATYDNSKVPVTVSAKYTYGQLVKGEATIKVRPEYEFYGETVKPNSKTIKVDKVGQTEIDIFSLLGQESQFYERTVVFDVVFKEDLTGKELNGSAKLTVHRHRCRLDFQRIYDHFTPGKEYKTILTMSTWDDKPYIDDSPIKVRHGFNYANLVNSTWTEYKNPGTGTLDLSFPTNENDSSLEIEVDYLGQSQRLYTSKFSRFDPETSNLDLNIIGDNFKIGDVLEVDVLPKETEAFTLYVIGRNELLETRNVQVSDKERASRVKLTISPYMSPECHILVVYVTRKGELLAAERQVKVQKFMNNFLKISASPDAVEPGKEVTLDIEAKPNSYVGLLGVDQSVLLLKKGNDISVEDVESELRAYDFADYQTKRGWGPGRPWFPWSHSGAKRSINDAGAVVLTNAYIHEEPITFAPQPAGAFGQAFAANGISPADRPVPTSSFHKPPAVPVQVRKVFPESWIWEERDSGPQGKTKLNKIVPDTITSWVITGFSLSPEFGLGLTENSTNVKVFRPFFISINLPYSVTREEVVAIPVNVFNYMDKELKAQVTFDNPGWFTFADNATSTDNRKKRDTDSSRTKVITLGANSASTATFIITPKSLGYKEIKVTAVSPLAGDAVSHKLLVKPEGDTQFRSKGLFIDLRDTNEFKVDVKLDIPEDVVPESELIEVSAVGDLLGSALNNLDKLIRQPYGCGEQNMLNFVPNIVILDYLKSTKQLTPAIESKAIKFLEMGYQRELTYKHKDHSYSAFGESDKSGSTWLTAFVAKSFIQAREFITISPETIIDSLTWLASKQHENGSFSEVGHISHKQMQGGASDGLALTSYVLTAFLEAKTLTTQFGKTIDKATEYINEHLKNNTIDVYSLAVSSYALNLAGHPSKDKAFEDLEAKAKSSADTKWWEKEKETKVKEENPWETWVPNAINVEITAYALLSYFHRNKTADTIPTLKWLLSQQNSEGGFASTQDTVVALGAIAKISKTFGEKGKDLNISFDYPNGSMKFRVQENNALVLQKGELPSTSIRSVTVTAKGSGFAVAQVSYRYNVNKKSAFPLFKLAPQVDKDSNKNNLILTVCTSFTGGEESNMAVMEVTLPSGFTIDDDAVKLLRVTDKVKKVEVKNEDTLVVLYFDKVTQKELCPTILATRTFQVAKQKPVPVTIYDYYDNSRRATEFYSAPASDVCDLCVDDDCEPCENKA